jgi:hypothetical protein
VQITLPATANGHRPPHQLQITEQKSGS